MIGVSGIGIKVLGLKSLEFRVRSLKFWDSWFMVWVWGLLGLV